jgi:hypothetical protein
MQVVCGIACARRVPIVNRKADREKLAAMRPLSYWVRQAQEAFNAWVRARDAGKPCISCQRQHTGKVNAGHYLSTGARPELRFEPLNVHLQCEPCNTNLSGNAILYRVNLLKLIGEEKLAWLEGPHEPKRYRADDLKAITATYRAKLRALQKDTP